MPRPTESPIIRFWRKVSIKGECWLWIGATNFAGYGIFGAGGRGNRVLCHRWIYEQTYGSIPEGYEIHHKCKNVRCIRPDHLIALHPLEHKKEHRLTHCKRGHEFTPENTEIRSKDGKRRCRICRNSYARMVRV